MTFVSFLAAMLHLLTQLEEQRQTAKMKVMPVNIAAENVIQERVIYMIITSCLLASGFQFYEAKYVASVNG